MLGDGGANLLGFTVGVGAYHVLPGWAVEVVAVIAVALNVLADTVTLSRAIDAYPPVRWVDRLGRIASGAD
jgi:UDP-GlcNAc:undecaprenyl-phosphate GlcNAc-1-phosphate transferase